MELIVIFMVQFIYESKYGGRREYQAYFEGVIPNLERRYRETNSEYSRDKIEEYMAETPCPKCKKKKREQGLKKKYYQF